MKKIEEFQIKYSPTSTMKDFDSSKLSNNEYIEYRLLNNEWNASITKVQKDKVNFMIRASNVNAELEKKKQKTIDGLNK